MDFLNQPYPYYHRGRSLLKFSALLFIIGYLFEYLIVPFPRNPDEHRYSYAVISLFHIGVAAVIYLIYFSVVSLFVQDDDWKVYKELIAVFFLLFCIGIGEWGIRPVIYHNGGGMSIKSLITEVWHAQLSGGIIYLLVTLVNLELLVRQHSIEASSFKSIPKTTPNTTIDISTRYASDDFSLAVAELICVQADGNYLEFYLNSENGTNKLMKRLSLTSLSEQLADVSTIVKTHRAFMVNPSFICTVEGNAQGYQLTLDGIDFKVPVSRKHLETFNRYIR
jgi:hypothetical protein